MSNPKFLNVEKRVPYNVRLPKRLIDKLNSYAELTGNTTTNIINSVLDDFLSDKIVLNDYLDNIGGLTVKIPYAINQKNHFIKEKFDLIGFNADERIIYYTVDTSHSETYFAELFEIKKISNNLDIYDGDSFVANKKILKFNQNAIHSGIELFIYNITEIIFADSTIIDEFDSFINCLYCLYFEVAANDDVKVYLIDYLTAINLLSASGNDDYKDLIIAAATELSAVDDIVFSYMDKFYDSEIDDHDLPDGISIADKLNAECKIKCDETVSAIADKYNSNNIIKFGTDIFSRLAIKEIDSASNDFDELIDKIITEKIDEKVGELLKTENSSIEKLSEIEIMNNELNDKIDKISEIIESGLNKNQ